MEEFVSQAFGVLFGFVLPFAPAIYVFWRLRNSENPPSDDIVKLALAWTALMLLFADGRARDANRQLQTVCNQLEVALNQNLGDGGSATEEMPYYCFPEDYADFADN